MKTKKAALTLMLVLKQQDMICLRQRAGWRAEVNLSQQYFLFKCDCGHKFVGRKQKGACSKCYARLEGKAV